MPMVYSNSIFMQMGHALCLATDSHHSPVLVTTISAILFAHQQRLIKMCFLKNLSSLDQIILASALRRISTYLRFGRKFDLTLYVSSQPSNQISFSFEFYFHIIFLLFGSSNTCTLFVHQGCSVIYLFLNLKTFCLSSFLFPLFELLQL